MKPNRTIFTIAILFPLLFNSTIQSDNTPIDHKLAERYFFDVQQLLQNDGGKLWGKSLEGPILFVDPSSRIIVANYPDKDGKLVRRGNIYTGTLPEDIPIANTAINWAGVHWAMVMWYEFTDHHARNVLLIHELWHRIQEEIGFSPTNPSNDHLDTRDGRIWLRLEKRALTLALDRLGTDRRSAIRDALIFRAHRLNLFPHAQTEEQQLEMHEGLAEYTGLTLGITSRNERIQFTIKKLKRGDQLQSFTRSFAYNTIPAYGILLDEVHSGWQRSITSESNIPTLVRQHYGINIPFNIEDEAQGRAQIYDGNNIIKEETERYERRRREITEYKERFIDGPRLVLPLTEMKLSFDPRTVTPIEGYGRVYKTLTIIDTWGTLKAPGGALVANDWSVGFVPAPEKINTNSIEGLGYSLELKNGWYLSPGGREGDYIILRRE